MSRDRQRLVDYLGHIAQGIERIDRYTRDIDEAEFAAAHPELPLSFAYQMRNAVAHGYFKVDFEIVWRTIYRDLPGLYERVRSLVDHPQAPPTADVAKKSPASGGA